MEKTLDSTISSRPLTEKLCRIWERLENLIPRKLYEDTLQIWLNTPLAATTGYIEVDNDLLLTKTPSIIFCVDSRIFKSPPHLKCLVHILAFYLEVSRNANNQKLIKSNIQNITQTKKFFF